MRIVYKKYLPDQEIPIYEHVSRRKLVKYYTRETMAAIICMGELFADKKPSTETPFFYSSAETEMMDFYKKACNTFADSNTPFSSFYFIKKAVPSISPLSHFKMMRNMAHCFISIEYGLKGDNANLLGSASGLLVSALLSESQGPVIMGAGKLHANGTAEAGIAVLMPGELTEHPMLNSNKEAIFFFRESSNI